MLSRAMATRPRAPTGPGSCGRRNSAAGSSGADRKGEHLMSDPAAPPGKLMVDPYLDWTRSEGVPVHEEFALDLNAIATETWPRLDARGAIVHVKGRGDFMSIFLIEIPPGGKTSPQKHLFEGAALVISGHG